MMGALFAHLLVRRRARGVGDNATQTRAVTILSPGRMRERGVQTDWNLDPSLRYDALYSFYQPQYPEGELENLHPRVEEGGFANGYPPLPDE